MSCGIIEAWPISVNLTALTTVVIDEEKIVSWTEDIIQPEVVSPEIVSIIVLNGGCCEPAIVEIEVDSCVDDMVCETALALGFANATRSRKSRFVDAVSHLRGKLIRQPQTRVGAEFMQSPCPPIAHVPCPAYYLS